MHIEVVSRKEVKNMEKLLIDTIYNKGCMGVDEK